MATPAFVTQHESSTHHWFEMNKVKHFFQIEKTEANGLGNIVDCFAWSVFTLSGNYGRRFQQRVQKVMCIRKRKRCIVLNPPDLILQE